MADSLTRADCLTIIGDEGILTRQARELAALVGYQSVRCVSKPDADIEFGFVALGDLNRRSEVIAAMDSRVLVNLIHPSAVISPHAELAHSIMIGPQAIVGSQARVGTGVIQNALSSIEHDDQIGEFCFLGTGAILCGGVSLGERVFIGGGATVKPGVSIGARTTIGTGAVVVKDAAADSVYVGNPARAIS